MDNKRLNLRENPLDSEIKQSPEKNQELGIDLADVNLDFLDEAGEGDGEVNEDEKSGKESKGSSLAGKGGGVQAKIQVVEKPTIPQMVKQVEMAVLKELEKCKEEEKLLKKQGEINPVKLNDVVIRIRTLNQLLLTLSDYLRLAEDFVVNLWNKFVAKK